MKIYIAHISASEDAQGAIAMSSAALCFVFHSGTNKPGERDKLLANERENFRVLYDKVSELGGVPGVVKSAEMSNTIPDEKVGGKATDNFYFFSTLFCITVFVNLYQQIRNLVSQHHRS